MCLHSQTLLTRWSVTVVLLVLLAGTGWAQSTTDPVRAIVAAFDRVNLVALGERHLSEKDLEFRLRLIRDPAFTHKVNDIVIEFANAMHQSILDRFTNGEDVSREDLDKVWTVADQKSAYAPFYQEFVDGVRAVNNTLPPERRLRVVAGDSRGRSRDEMAADRIRREVLDKHRKALVVFGGFHLHYHQLEFGAERSPAGNITMILQHDPRARWFVVEPLSGPNLPRLVTMHSSTADTPTLIADRAALEMDAAAVGMADRPNQFRIRDLVDAILYLGNAAPVIRSLH